MKRLLMIVMILGLAPATSQAQSILHRLERAARSAAERTAERKVEEKAEKTTEEKMDKPRMRTSTSLDNRFTRNMGGRYTGLRSATVIPPPA